MAKKLSDMQARTLVDFCHTIRGKGQDNWDTLTFVEPEASVEMVADALAEVEA